MAGFFVDINRRGEVVGKGDFLRFTQVCVFLSKSSNFSAHVRMIESNQLANFFSGVALKVERHNFAEFCKVIRSNFSQNSDKSSKPSDTRSAEFCQTGKGCQNSDNL